MVQAICAGYGQGNFTPQLFQDAGDGAGTAAGSIQDIEKHQRLDAALDKLRAHYVRKVIYFGGVQESRDQAPMRIAFTHIPDAGLEGIDPLPILTGDSCRACANQ